MLCVSVRTFRVSCLEDVLITAARRLIHPTLHPSTERFSDTATSAVCRIISCCSDVAATLSVPHNLHTALGTSSSTDWQAVRAELSRSSAAAMQEYWEFVYSRRHSQLKVARSSEVGITESGSGYVVLVDIGRCRLQDTECNERCYAGLFGVKSSQNSCTQATGTCYLHSSQQQSFLLQFQLTVAVNYCCAADTGSDVCVGDGGRFV